MNQNIEQRTEIAVKKYETASDTADKLAHTDSNVLTPVGYRNSFPKISRVWDEESQRLQKDWSDESQRLQREFRNESAVIREDWQNERDALSTKALGVKLWESGKSESNINQQRRWTDNNTYLPKMVPAVMTSSGPDDNWIPYTADKSDILNDVFGREPVDLIVGMVLVPDTDKQYPKVRALGALWELDDNDTQLSVSSFYESSDGQLVIVLDDNTQVLASKISGSSRSWVGQKMSSMEESLLGMRVYPAHPIKYAINGDLIPQGTQALRVKMPDNTVLAVEIYPQASGELTDLHFEPFKCKIAGTVISLKPAITITSEFNAIQFGVSSHQDSVTNTENINKMLSLSGGPTIARFVFDQPGDIYVEGHIRIPNNTDIVIERGTRIINRWGVNRPVFVSEYWWETIAEPSDLTKKSDYLGISGGGEIHYNKNGTAPGGLNRHAICIAGVKNLYISDQLKVGGAFKYAWLVANVDYLNCPTGLMFDNESDGLHLQPPIYYAHIRNLRGHTGDDMLALTGGDYGEYDIGTRGDFSYIDVEGLYNDNTLCAFKAAGNEGVVFHHLSVKGIYGTCQHSPIRLWADHNLVRTDIKHASFKEIAAIPSEGYDILEVSDRGLGEIVIDHLEMTEVSSRVDSGGRKAFSLSGSVKAEVYTAELELPRNINVGFSIGEGEGNDKCRIYDLNIKSTNSKLQNNEYSSLALITRGVVDSISVCGVSDNAPLSSLVQQRGGSVHSVLVDSVKYNVGSLFKQYMANDDGSLPTVIISNMPLKDVGMLAEFKNGGSLHASNVVLYSSSGHKVHTETGLCSITGQITYGNSLIPSSPPAGTYYRAYGFSLNVDASALQRFEGQYCYNTNAAFGTGVGLVAFADGHGWKNIVTGSNG